MELLPPAGKRRQNGEQSDCRRWGKGRPKQVVSVFCFFFFFKFGACYIHRSVHWILLTRIERAGLSSRCGYMAAGPLCLLALRLFRAVFYGLTSDPPKTREEFVIKQPNSWDHHGNVFFSDHTRCFFLFFFRISFASALCVCYDIGVRIIRSTFTFFLPPEADIYIFSF